MNKLSKTLLTAFSFAGYAMLLPASVFAEDINLGPTVLPEGFGGAAGITVQSFVSGAIRLLLVVAALAFFFMLVVGGIQWIFSGGDKAATESARKKITNALIGLAIVFAAWAIAALIKTLFGVDILTLDIPTFTTTAPTQSQ
ncbi:hypothetical protein C4578_00205 [Candidatus Microgenomates bacterium]|jgi:hypothetical protein|nr:MAG: hypothetical protein C4578_00205 [Candidatus Microgenomates bacterium]